MNGKAPLAFVMMRPGYNRRNLAERGVSLLLEVLELTVVGAKLAAQLLQEMNCGGGSFAR